LRTIWNELHNGFFYNDGLLSGDELMWQFNHVVSCYEAIGISVEGMVCDASGQNVRLFSYLWLEKPLGATGCLNKNLVAVANPANPVRNISCWFCSTHQLKNVQNTLLSSHVNGNHAFMKNGCTISWNVVEECFKGILCLFQQPWP